MKSVYHFLRLIRLTNLLVIGLCMSVFQVFIASHGNADAPHSFSDYSVYEGFQESSFAEKWLIPFNLNFNFLLFVFSVLFVAAAGNIINDYFDVRADRINKPDRLIVGKFIKRRWAMFMHWSFNSIGLLLSLYLSWVLHNWWIVLICFLSINILWFYSSLYKRKLLLGNVMVALLLAVLPIYVMVFNKPINNFDILLNVNAEASIFITVYRFYVIDVVLMVSGIAFLINLIREIIKDIADVRGDMRLGSTTFPIKFGIRKAKWLVLIIALPLILFIVFYYCDIWWFDFEQLKGNTLGLPDGIKVPDLINFRGLFACLLLAVFCIIASILILLRTDKRKYYLLSSNILKLAMLFGLISPLFL